MAAEKNKYLRYTAQSLMDEDSFIHWLQVADPGQRIVYHRGYLARDQYRGADNKTPPTALDRIAAVARAALMFEGLGHVHLVQKRHGNWDYEYIAERRVPPPARQANRTTTQRDIHGYRGADRDVRGAPG